MTTSVPSSSVGQATFCATLVDQLVIDGLSDVVICPGSRSTPLALAFAARDELAVHVRIDERSAAFFALGRSLATRRPVVILVTSGTAAAELHAAVAEADLASVSLIVITADRPPELHGVGAPQTIEQTHIFGAMVRDFVEPGVARQEARSSWRALARRVWKSARGDVGRPGPIHLNVAFVEPLVAAPLELPAALSREDLSTPSASVSDFHCSGKVLAIVGPGVDPTMTAQMQARNWVVVGDATSVATLAHYDAIVRHDDWAHTLRPDVVIRVGGLVASKVLAQRLREWEVPVVACYIAGPVADPDALIQSTTVDLGDPENTLASATYLAQWRELSARIGRAWSEYWPLHWSEPAVVAAVVDFANESQTPLVVGSSMPVRDVEWWAPPRLTSVYANRGTNGIDGVVSTVMGVGSGGRTIGLVGDVTMLHDVSALVDGAPNSHVVLVVLDNGGGGIFSFLSQSEMVDSDTFETLFGTPRDHDLVRVAQGFGHYATRVHDHDGLRQALKEGLERDGLSVVVAAMGSRSTNVDTHRDLVAMARQWGEA